MQEFEQWVAVDDDGVAAFELMRRVNDTASAQEKLFPLWQQFTITKR